MVGPVAENRPGQAGPGIREFGPGRRRRRPGDGLAIDYKIITAIRAFEINADAGERAVVEISAKVLNDRNGVVLASKVFRSTSPVTGSGNAAYVQSLDRAFEVVVRDLVGWTLSRI